ncbi:MAG: class I SAM-dependent methyltransferase [Anaerolineae bacterium]|nr:class I SAM-dependent methyltransferase [Anaerolineae bacterium]
MTGLLPLERQEAWRERYRREHPGWRPATHVYRDLMARHLGPGTRVLDLGCGRGGILEELRPRAGWAAGVDPDWASLAEHRMPDFPRAGARAESLPFPDGAFDLVCCSWVLEHLPKPEEALREVARVLKLGGHFIFLTPNVLHPLVGANHLLRGTGGRWVHWLYGRAGADTFPALYRANSPHRLRALLKGAGLEVRALIPVGDPTYLAFNEVLYRLSCALEALLPPWAKVHLVGEARKGSGDPSPEFGEWR